MNAIKTGERMMKYIDYTNNKISELFSLGDIIEDINVVFNILSGLEMAEND